MTMYPHEVYVDADGDVWIVTNTGGVFCVSTNELPEATRCEAISAGEDIDSTTRTDLNRGAWGAKRVYQS